MERDLMCFGVTYESLKIQDKFCVDVYTKFCDVKVTNDYDPKLGHRKVIDDENLCEIDYLCWILTGGWYRMSTNFQLLVAATDNKKKIKYRKVLNRAKILYPKYFIQDTLKKQKKC